MDWVGDEEALEQAIPGKYISELLKLIKLSESSPFLLFKYTMIRTIEKRDLPLQLLTVQCPMRTMHLPASSVIKPSLLQTSHTFGLLAFHRKIAPRT